MGPIQVNEKRADWTYHTNEVAATMACREGLEPPTPNLEGSCSIQMSYRQT